jgi:hypothetical protein
MMVPALIAFNVPQTVSAVVRHSLVQLAMEMIRQQEIIQTDVPA